MQRNVYNKRVIVPMAMHRAEAWGMRSTERIKVNGLN